MQDVGGVDRALSLIVCHVTRAAMHVQDLRLHARPRESTCMHAVLRVALDLLKDNR